MQILNLGWIQWGLALLFSLFFQVVVAQHQEVNEKPGIWKNQVSDTDSQKFVDVFKQGVISGHFRSFFMSTQNTASLKDDYALAAGGGLKFESKPLYGFRFGLSGVYVFDVLSSDLLQPDTTTGQSNRYELGLFDISPRDSDLDVSRLEELYLSWKKNGFKATLGKQHINTPFINLQDGRMRPTAVDGIWMEWKGKEGLGFSGGYLYGMSPRSTSRYYNIGNSIGLYPSGVSTDGKPSSYKSQLDLDGILYGGLTGKAGKAIKWQTWQMWVTDLYYSSLYQIDALFKVRNNNHVIGGLQVIYQRETGNGGIGEASHRYIDEGAQALVYGARLGYGYENKTFTLSMTRITDTGRYLLPREWGRDPFYTFMARERNEGYGDLTAWVMQWSSQTGIKGLKYTVALGLFDMPDVRNFELNKYGMPSYVQANLDLRYRFGGYLRGLEGQVLYLHKWKTGEDYGNLKYVYNKVDMSNLNVVMNFYF